jgi:hypothetical protein
LFKVLRTLALPAVPEAIIREYCGSNEQHFLADIPFGIGGFSFFPQQLKKLDCMFFFPLKLQVWIKKGTPTEPADTPKTSSMPTRDKNNLFTQQRYSKQNDTPKIGKAPGSP